MEDETKEKVDLSKKKKVKLSFERVLGLTVLTIFILLTIIYILLFLKYNK